MILQTTHASAAARGPVRAPRILIFDSGLGGLTVHAQTRLLRPDADYIYAADDAAFPYGAMYGPKLLARVLRVMDWLIDAHRPDLVVIACNTASTLVLPHVRARFPDIPFVGAVPAIKPAAALSRSRLVCVLATPGTVARDYTQDLIRDYGADCDMTLVGSTALATLAEAFMQGQPVQDDAIAAEIRPCFVEKDGRRTDVVVLACTHYPLLLAQFNRLAPWPVIWIDPAPAIARRVDSLLIERGFPRSDREAGSGIALFTSGLCVEGALADALRDRHLDCVNRDSLPFPAEMR